MSIPRRPDSRRSPEETAPAFQKELDEWLGAEGELFAALAVGYAAEAPQARPRKEMRDAVEWRER